MDSDHLERFAMEALRQDLDRTDAWQALAMNELELDAPVQRFAVQGVRRERL